VDLEGAHGILVMSGHEDDRGLVRFPQRRHDLEAVETRHLDIEQHHVRRMLPNRLYCFLAVGAGGDYFRVGLSLQQPHQTLPANRLVIRYDDSQCHPTSSSRSRCESGTGV
jgi:hypothetical protein